MRRALLTALLWPLLFVLSAGAQESVLISGNGDPNGAHACSRAGLYYKDNGPADAMYICTKEGDLASAQWTRTGAAGVELNVVNDPADAAALWAAGTGTNPVVRVALKHGEYTTSGPTALVVPTHTGAGYFEFDCYNSQINMVTATDNQSIIAVNYDEEQAGDVVVLRNCRLLATGSGALPWGVESVGGDQAGTHSLVLENVQWGASGFTQPGTACCNRATGMVPQIRIRHSRLVGNGTSNADVLQLRTSNLVELTDNWIEGRGANDTGDLCVDHLDTGTLSAAFVSSGNVYRFCNGFFSNWFQTSGFEGDFFDRLGSETLGNPWFNFQYGLRVNGTYLGCQGPLNNCALRIYDIKSGLGEPVVISLTSSEDDDGSGGGCPSLFTDSNGYLVGLAGSPGTLVPQILDVSIHAGRSGVGGCQPASSDVMTSAAVSHIQANGYSNGRNVGHVRIDRLWGRRIVGDYVGPIGGDLGSLGVDQTASPRTISTGELFADAWVTNNGATASVEFDLPSNAARFGPGSHLCFVQAETPHQDIVIDPNESEQILGLTDAGGDSVTNVQADTTATTLDAVAADDSYTRASGSFIADGFKPGQVIVVSGFTNGGNNGQKHVSNVLPATLYVEEALVNETGGGDEQLLEDTFGCTLCLIALGYGAPHSGWAAQKGGDPCNWADTD